MALEDTPNPGGTSTDSSDSDTDEDNTRRNRSAAASTQTIPDQNLGAPGGGGGGGGDDDDNDGGDDGDTGGGSGGGGDDGGGDGGLLGPPDDNTGDSDGDDDSSGDDAGSDSGTDSGGMDDGGRNGGSGGTAPGTPGSGGELDAPGDDIDDPDTEAKPDAGGDEQQTTPDTGGIADAPGTGTEPEEPMGDDRTGGPVREDFDSAAGFVEASAADALPGVTESEVFTVESGGTVEARFTEEGARTATARLAGEGVTESDVELGEPAGRGFTVDDISESLEAERQDLRSDLGQYSEERQDLRKDALSEARIEAGMEARAEAERRQKEMQEVFQRGNLAPARDVRAEAAAEEVSEDLGFEVTSEDIQLREGEDGEGFNVELSDEAQRAAQVSSSAEFLRRDASLSRTEDREFDVDLPGDNPAVETAIERRIRTGEAFGGETKISVLGQTLNVEQATEDIAGAVEGTASDAADFVDDANLLSNRPAFVDDDTSQSIIGARSGREAGEDVLLRAGEQGIAAIGNAPKDLLEAGEAATDPLTYRVAGDLAGTGLDAVDDVSIDSVVTAGEGAVETAERADEAAQENPDLAAGVVAGGLGGAAAVGGSFAASSRALSGVSSVSPKAARGLELALDPVKTSARGVSTAARRVDTPDADSIKRLGIPDDNRAQANLLQMGRQRSRGDADGIDSDPDSGGGSDFDPSRDYLLEGGTQERARLELIEQQRADLEASRGTFEGEPDAFGSGRQATFDPEQDVLEPEEILTTAQRSEVDVGSQQLARTADVDATDVAVRQRTASLFASEIAADSVSQTMNLDFESGSLDDTQAGTRGDADIRADEFEATGVDDATAADVDVSAASASATATATDTEFTTTTTESALSESKTTTLSETEAEIVTETKAESEFQARPNARRRSSLDLPDFDAGREDAGMGDAEDASDLFDNPTISPEEALDYNPLED